MTLIIVESPTKARTITRFLGSEYTVKASMGHVRDLPEKATDIPAKYKKEKWARLGVDVAHDFAPLYVVSSDKKKTIKELKDLVAKHNDVILATDEDREGEAISWHLSEVLGIKSPKRIVFHEITKDAIQNALQNPRKIDLQVVQAQETRRILDRLVGYTISPLLWKKIKFGLSAGRVQSVAMRLIVNREKERMDFKKAGYHAVHATLLAGAESFKATLTQVDGKRIAIGKDFDERGQLTDPSCTVLTASDAKSLSETMQSLSYTVTQVTTTRVQRVPPPPYITSSLQIEANRKLGFSSKQTMQVAQKLYENGHITYMRTDSVHLSDQALAGAKKKILSSFGDSYYAGYYRKYKSKSKGAQEAHEAIRPAGFDFATAAEKGLFGDEAALYEMIWRRTIASQMKEAQLDQTAITFTEVAIAPRYTLRSTGTTVFFDGFLRVMGKLVTSEDDQDLPKLNQSEVLSCKEIDTTSHETKPPARYNDASLVKKLETEGIGRPSTYASIISTIQARGYVRRIQNQLIPTVAAFAVNNLLERCFPNLVDLKFTSQMEDSLDDIETGKTQWLPYLSSFYQGETGLETEVLRAEETIDPREISTLTLPHIKPSNPIRYGKYGAYVDFGDVKATLPDDKEIADITQEYLESLQKTKQISTDAFCKDTDGNPVHIKSGKYGPYLSVELVNTPKKGKAKNTTRFVSIPPQYSVENLTKETVLLLLSLPRVIGTSEDGVEIKANFGRFGPYVQKNTTYASIPKDESVFTVSLERAVELIREKESKPKRVFRRFRKSKES